MKNAKESFIGLKGLPDLNCFHNLYNKINS